MLACLPNVLLDRLQSVYYAPPTDLLGSQVRSCISVALASLVTSSGMISVPSGSVRFSLSTASMILHHHNSPLCRAHSCRRRRFSTATPITKHGGACHSAIEVLDILLSCVSSRGSTSLEQFATFHLVVSTAAIIHVETEGRAPRTMPLNTYQHSIASNLCTSFVFILSRDPEVPRS